MAGMIEGMCRCGEVLCHTSRTFSTIQRAVFAPAIIQVLRQDLEGLFFRQESVSLYTPDQSLVDFFLFAILTVFHFAFHAKKCPPVPYRVQTPPAKRPHVAHSLNFCQSFDPIPVVVHPLRTPIIYILNST